MPNDAVEGRALARTLGRLVGKGHSNPFVLKFRSIDGVHVVRSRMEHFIASVYYPVRRLNDALDRFPSGDKHGGAAGRNTEKRLCRSSANTDLPVL